MTQKLEEQRSYEVEAGNGVSYCRNRRHINTTKEVFVKKHATDDETEPILENTAITVPAPRPTIPSGVTVTTSGRIIKPLHASET